MSFYGTSNAPPPGPLIPSDANYLSLLMKKPKVTKSTVVQATDITTSVTLNAAAGVITTQASTLAADGEEAFSLLCNSIAASSVVMVSVLNYAGTTGIPNIRVDSVSEGGCNMVMTNSSSADPLNGTMIIGFVVV